MRNILRVTITDEGRDKGKIFVIKEMSSRAAEKWAARALIALVKSGLLSDKDQDRAKSLMGAGMAGVAAVGAGPFINIDWNDLEPLMDEMFECISFQPGANPDVVRPLIEDDVDEVQTRLRLRAEVFNLHVGPSVADLVSKLVLRSAQNLTTTQVSPGSSE